MIICCAVLVLSYCAVNRARCGGGHDRARCGGWVVCVGKTLYNVKCNLINKIKLKLTLDYGEVAG